MTPSERIVVEAPMSFTGSARRIWRWSSSTFVRWIFLSPIVLMAWVAVLCWYVVFGLWVIPYRVIRRGQRQRRLDEARHTETLEVARRHGL